MENKTEQPKSKSIIEVCAKWIIIFIFTTTICIKIYNSDTVLDLSKFDFSNLLSLILALFAIWISINFYHKNNQTSNKFYNNTYQFTKDISETLGRIEERFGEKLESLKEENKSLSGRIDKYYSATPHSKEDIEKEQAKLKKIQEELKGKNAELEKMVENISTKYNIVEKDKNVFFKELEEKNTEIISLKRKIKLFEETKPSDIKLDIPRGITIYTKRKLMDVEIRNKYSSLKEVDKPYFFKFFRDYFSKDYLVDLEKYDLIDSECILTKKGMAFLNNII